MQQGTAGAGGWQLARSQVPEPPLPPGPAPPKLVPPIGLKLPPDASALITPLPPLPPPPFLPAEPPLSNVLPWPSLPPHPAATPAITAAHAIIRVTQTHIPSSSILRPGWRFPKREAIRS